MGSLVGKVIVWAFVVVIMVGFAAAPAAIMTEVAPDTTARAMQGVLCPPGTTAKLIVDYGLGTPIPESPDTTRPQTQRVRCYDNQGVAQVGEGDRFADLWYGYWMLGGALVATLGVITFFVWQDVIKPAGGPTATA